MPSTAPPATAVPTVTVTAPLTQMATVAGDVVGAPELVSLAGRPFTPDRIRVDYARGDRDSSWRWIASVTGPSPDEHRQAPHWVGYASTAPDTACPAWVAEFAAQHHPGCRRDHVAPIHDPNRRDDCCCYVRSDAPHMPWCGVAGEQS